jgi:PAS domain S-box-containing protein
MQLPPDIGIQQRLRKWSNYLATSVIIIALLSLIGWQWNIALLRDPFSSVVIMNPVSAIGFILSVLSMRLFARNSSGYTAYVLSILVLLIGVLTFISHIFGFSFQIDTLLFTHDIVNGGTADPGRRMTANTALCFALIGCCLVFFPGKSKKQILSQVAVVLVGLLSLLSFLGYLYLVQSFYGLLSFVTMPASTTICFLLFVLSVLFAEPAKGVMKEITSTLSGSLMFRLLIPATIIIPSALGLFRLFGNWGGLYNTDFGATLFVLSVIILFAGITWYNAVLLNRRDMLRIRSEEALHEREDQIQAIFNNAPDAVVVVDSDARVKRWNPESEKLFGWRKEEAIGKTLNEIIVPPRYSQSHIKGMQIFRVTGQSKILSKTVDLKAVKKDQTEIDVSVRISPFITAQQLLFVGFIRDITERKRLEDKLRSFNEELSTKVLEKTSELKEIFERVTDGFIALDRNFCYTYMNKKAGKLARRDPDTIIGKNVWEEFPAAINSSTFEAFNKAMKEQKYVTNTDYYKPYDLWYESSVFPSPNGLSIFMRDITEQKKSEKEISKVKALADNLIDSLPGVFYFFDLQGRFIRWNKQLEDVTGYSAGEMATMHPADFFEAKEKNYVVARIQGIFQKGINDTDANLITKDGRKIPYFFKTVMIEYEGGPCLLGNGIDITERKKAETELRASEQKYKLLFESNPLPMWMLTLPDYRFIDVNSVALLQYGYTKEEFLKLSPMDFRPPKDLKKLKALTSTEFRGVHHAGIWRHKKKDGTIIYVDIVTHDINHKGQMRRLVLANNITERHAAEEKLKESYEAIRTLTGYLQNVREQERLNISREIHDELGQLLTVLKMDVSWLNKKIGGENSMVKEKLSEILNLVDTTVRSIRRIASELRPTLLDDLGLYAAMEWHLEEFERRSGIRRELVIPENELALSDSLKIGIFRIFQESLTNVARHSEAKNVNVSLLQKDNQLILTIRDNGIGFEQGPMATKKTLGLLGMKERSMMMGGVYNITSARGAGTTVTVIIPLSKKAV